jgi:NADPH:quinone reductase-like Zn-dependent oxidoreductase
VDLNLMWDKSVTLVWEMVFTRTEFDTGDMARHGEILDRVAELVDAGVLTSPLTQVIGPVSATHLHRALSVLQQGRTLGKLVLSGF